jgi:hypothetical protein
LLPASSAGTETTAALETKINFSGVWQLNQDLSDKFGPPPSREESDLRRNTGGVPGQMPGDMSGGMAGRGAGMGGRGRGGSGGVGGMGGQGGRMRMTSGEQGQRQQVRAMMEEMRQGRERLLITHVEPELEIIDARDKTLHVLTDNSPVQRSTDYGDVTDQAWWQDVQLVIKTHMADAQTITRTYELDPSADQLIVSIRVDMPQMNRTHEFRLVYDSV